MNTFIKSFKNLDLQLKIILILIILLPWTLIFQGLNCIDEGFIITNFYYFFSSPENINYGFTHYLTDFLGAIFNIIFNNLGLIGFRIGWIIIIYLIYFVSYFILKRFLSIKHILIGFLLSFLFLNNVDTINWVTYPYTTTLFYSLSIGLLYYGLINNSNKLILLSGFFIGINVFFRLPNIVLIFLFLLIPVYYLYFSLQKLKFKIILLKLFIFLFGTFFGISLILFLINILGHYNLFLDAIKMIFGMANEGIQTRNHGLSYLILLYSKSLFFVILISGLISFFLLIILKLQKKFKYNLFMIYSVIVGIILGIISVLKFYLGFYIFGLNFFISYISYIYPLLFLLVLIMVFKNNTYNLNIKFLYLLGMFFILTVQIGSGGYLELMQNSGFIIFPLVIKYISDTKLDNSINNIIKSFIIIIIISSTISTLGMIYKNNKEFTFLSIGKINFLNINKNTYNEINTVKINIFDKYNGKKLLFLSNFGYGSYFYYLFNIKPYLGNSVPAYYSVNDYKNKLIEKLNTNDYPIILIDKYKNISKNNSYISHGIEMEKITFDIFKVYGIKYKKILETENFIFYLSYNEKDYKG
nr:hypothetical protein [Candidatus Gracilibacteria bacterium]